MNACELGITRAGISCGPPEGMGKEVPLGIVASEHVWAEGNAQGLIKVLVDRDAALGKRDTQLGGFDLEDEVLEADGIVIIDSAFSVDGKDQVQIEMRRKGDKGRAGLFGFDLELAVEVREEDFLDETVGSFFSFNSVETEFIGKPALKGFIHAFRAASGLGRISWNGTNAKAGKGPADLSKMAFLDGSSRLGGEEEMTGSIRIQGAEDAMFFDAIPEQPHAFQGTFLLNELHVVDFVGGIVHEDK